MAITTPQGRTATSLAEINVTPLVDVMLVLLVIFMVTAPILQTGIEVKLPETRSVATVNPEQRIVLSISKEGLIYYRSDPINFSAIPDRIRKDAGNKKDPIFLRADADVKWNYITAVLDTVRSTGYENVQIVTKPFKAPRSR